MQVTRQKIASWVFATAFVVIGVLNAALVHAVPGVFYLCLALLYLPATDGLLRRWLGFAVPFWLKVVAGLVALWGTLAVGDLAEVLGL